MPEYLTHSQHTDLRKSTGHVCFIGAFELYRDAAGELQRAPTSNAFDIDTGTRHARWEAPSSLAVSGCSMLIKDALKRGMSISCSSEFIA